MTGPANDGAPLTCPVPLFHAAAPTSVARAMEIYRAFCEADEGGGPERCFTSEGMPALEDYQPLIQSFGEVVVQCSEGRDMFVLARSGARFGLLIFGRGSQSWDALEACRSWEDIALLRDELARGIRWFLDASQALSYVQAHDWNAAWTWNR